MNLALTGILNFKLAYNLPIGTVVLNLDLHIEITCEAFKTPYDQTQLNQNL